MVDGITNQPVNWIATTVAATATAAPVQPVQPSPASPAAASGADTAQAGSLARTMASEAPVDTDRVQRIKRAIAEGRFPILPSTIADRLLALKLQWNPNQDTSNDAA